MSTPDLSQRQHSCFISYASEDGELARQIRDWLSKAGLSVWLDTQRLGAGSGVLEELTREICNSKAAIVLLTEKSLSKKYVKHEVEIICDQQVNCPGFTLIAARTSKDLDPTEHFPSLRKLSWFDMPDGKLDIQSARRLLLSLTPPVVHAKGQRHVFVSCGWGANDEQLNRNVSSLLAKRGVRLIGDARDQQHFSEDGKTRIRRIMSGCGGHLLILPERKSPGKTAEEVYKYFLAEWEIGRQLCLSRRIFCVSRAVLPGILQEEAIEVGQNGTTGDVEKHLLDLHDEIEPAEPYAFLAAEVERGPERNEAARDILEHVLGMGCLLGKDYMGASLRERIVESVMGSNIFIADLASQYNPSTGKLQSNLNTCIEAGIAIGAQRTVFVTALDPKSVNQEVHDRTTQVPFMFRNDQIIWYSDAVDFLARIHRIALSMRRRIINQELLSS